MFKIAQQLKKKNIAEYIVYMWQVEDLIRANKLDIEQVKKTLILPVTTSQEEVETEVNWFNELIDMMRLEGVKEKGHLQINRIEILKLMDLHQQLIASSHFPFYSAAYYKALPFIVELRSKNREENHSELETCFEALYGVMLLRIKGQEVSQSTTNAIEVIAAFISMLANYHEKDLTGELKLD